VLGVAPEPAPRLREMIHTVKSLTARSFGVDFIVENSAMGPLTTDEHIDICVAEAVPVVVFFWHFPPAAWVERLHTAGAKVWRQVGSLDRAREAVRVGMDALMGRAYPAGACDVVFEPYDWHTLYATQHKTAPPQEPPLRAMVRSLAQLAGFLARTADGEPGVKSIWQGYQRLHEFIYVVETHRTVSVP
jgi:hypothetical protein